jgi:predicted transcriptional regulator
MPNLTKTEVAQALKHPLRQRLLPAFVANRPLSPKEASNLLNEPLSDVSYHVKVLADYGFLVLRARAQVRGALKSYYLPNDETLNSTVVEEFFARNPPIGLD